ncbi:LysR family transcriptional regulator [Propionivibrio dicarboxylicus]|uniref:DNA-binding transcriptional regulator, LysR family n=1 Tax=Propionivibrio dicarboxylicus TaxID=83767 RepID=A0A1G8A9R3_9RHOO|nr:LysR family transcriptional regulator [Propionivibrio dicarboxylicus]SDH17621.1 DNA-binding transcriptional regulator, LysR family [Propionivibrio dicarboxylicus]
MELKQLKYFAAVCRLGSVTRAAESCHIAQPAISVAIQNLESELGVQLFERSHKKISVTSSGRVFLRRVEDILARTDDAIREMEDHRASQRGVIRVGITPMIGAVFFPEIVSRFREEHPLLELNVIEEGALSIGTLLDKGELDVGVVVVAEKQPQLEMSPITRSEIYVCLSAEHPLAAQRRIAFPRLADEPFILFSEDTLSRRIILEECARHGISPHIVFSSNQITTIISLIERGVGISFLLEPLVRDHPKIVSRRLAKPLYLEAGMVWNPRRYLSNATRTFIEAIRRYTLDATGAG